MDDHDQDRDDYDFPRAAHPGREFATMALTALAVVGFVIWVVWKLV